MKSSKNLGVLLGGTSTGNCENPKSSLVNPFLRAA